MSVIHIKGVEWTSARHRNGTTFHHHNVSIATDDHGMSHLMAGNGPILSSLSRAELLAKGTKAILEAYASSFQPVWVQS